MDKRPTLKQIAELLGVSRMTVSRALKEGTSVDPQLRARVRETAARIGYQPDQRISRVMSAIRRSQAPDYRENLAFIWTHRARGADAFFRAEFEGANRRATHLGYKLEEFRLKDESLNGRALTRILVSRGIRGVLIAPPSFGRGHPHVWLEWGRFCCVLLGRSITNAGLARVQHDHYSGATLAVRQLRRQRFKRMGLVISRSMDERSARLVRSAFLSFHPLPLAEAARLIHAGDAYDARKFTRWLEQTRPDVLIAHFEEVFPRLDQLRGDLDPRGGLALVSLNRTGDPPGMAGVDQRRATIGEEGINVLVNRLQNHQFGLDPLAPSILIPGSWVDGAPAQPEGHEADAGRTQ